MDKRTRKTYGVTPPHRKPDHPLLAPPGEQKLAPIPADPLHLCPSCSYNLTGLTHHRCPECGNEFSRKEARMKGAGGAGIYDKGDLKVLWRSRCFTIIGLLLTAASFATPLYFAENRSGFCAVYVITFIPPLLVLLFLKWAIDAEWSTFILSAGFLAALMGVILLAFYIA